MRALKANISGNANTIIGFEADVLRTNMDNAIAIGYQAIVDNDNKIQLGNPDITDVATAGKLTTGSVTYLNVAGTPGTVLGYNSAGDLAWLPLKDSAFVYPPTAHLEEELILLKDRIRAREQALEIQQEELLAIVKSQQEQIAQLQRMVEHQFASN